MFRLVSLAASVVMLVSIATAQRVSSGQSEVQPPEIQENAAPAAGEETGMMAGNKPFSLTTAVDGELLYNFNENNELESLTAKKGVVFTSEDMTLNSDQMDYKTQTSEIVATGRKVVVRQGEMIATCQLFKYNPQNQASELSGNPIVYNKTRDGKISTTVGDKIVIATVNGKPTMKVHGGSRAPGLNQGGGPSVPVPSGAGNARLRLDESGSVSGTASSTGPTGSSNIVAPAAATATPASAAMGGGIGVPSLGGEAKPAEQPKSNRIDVNNPEDIKSFSKQ